MAKIPLVEGAYTARSLIASAQRCLNLYQEVNPQDAEAPICHYPTPGLTRLGTPPIPGAGRGIYLSSDGQLFAVIGAKLYYISPSWAFTELGSIGSASTPVSMIDNRTDVLLVDGSPNGYKVNLSSLAFAAIVDAAFYGADKADYLDTFILLNRPGTNQYYTTLSNIITPFDPLYFAAKTAWPDNLATLAVMRRELWLFGTDASTEIWYNAGGLQFPFEIVPGAYIEHGCIAKYSVAKQGLRLFWLGVDREGKNIVAMGERYESARISTSAIEAEIASYAVVSDAIGFCYQQQGHQFYVLTFPTADKTWVYDLTSQLWHERAWSDSDGEEHRWRPNCQILAYGKNLALDWENGDLYEIDLANYTDFDGPIHRRRGFPHLVGDGVQILYKSFMADMDCGNKTGALISDPAKLTLRWSDDRGHSWSNGLVQSFGATGQYRVRPNWLGLGLAQDRVFELYWDSPVFTALQGCWIDPERSLS